MYSYSCFDVCRVVFWSLGLRFGCRCRRRFLWSLGVSSPTKFSYIYLCAFMAFADGGSRIRQTVACGAASACCTVINHFGSLARKIYLLEKCKRAMQSPINTLSFSLTCWATISLPRRKHSWLFNEFKHIPLVHSHRNFATRIWFPRNRRANRSLHLARIHSCGFRKPR